MYQPKTVKIRRHWFLKRWFIQWGQDNYLVRRSLTSGMWGLFPDWSPGRPLFMGTHPKQVIEDARKYFKTREQFERNVA